MADHELAAAVEQVHETRRAVRALEDVILGDLDHWQPPAVSVQRVPLPGGGRVSSFSLAKSSLRAASHCSRDTTWGILIVRILSSDSACP